jgi:hypothetical protein
VTFPCDGGSGEVVLSYVIFSCVALLPKVSILAWRFSMIDGKGLIRSVCVSVALGPNNFYWYHIGKEGELS